MASTKVAPRVNLDEWLELRHKIHPGPTNRELVEHALTEIYKLMEWPAFHYVTYLNDPRNFSHTYKDPTYRYSTSYIRHEHLVTSDYFEMVGQTRQMARRRDPLHVLYSAYILHIPYLLDTRMTEYLRILCENVLEFNPRLRTPVILEKPAEFHIDGEGRLHSVEGPAVLWRSGHRQYFINGVRFGAEVFGGQITLSTINRQWNAERKRVMIERYGHDRYLKDMKAELIQEDEFGRLWEIHRSTRKRRAYWYTVLNAWGHGDQRYGPERTDPWRLYDRTKIKDRVIEYDYEWPTGEEDIKFVEVVNSSPEPDGTFRKYFLRVPPKTMTAREAIAWTFGFNKPRSYAPLVQT